MVCHKVPASFGHCSLALRFLSGVEMAAARFLEPRPIKVAADHCVAGPGSGEEWRGLSSIENAVLLVSQFREGTGSARRIGYESKPVRRLCRPLHRRLV